MISGQIHHQVERPDGVRFYLDETFMFVLENRNRSLLREELVRLGIAADEEEDVLSMLRMAGLIDGSEDDGTTD